jgi:hypothetical protein
MVMLGVLQLPCRLHHSLFYSSSQIASSRPQGQYLSVSLVSAKLSLIYLKIENIQVLLKWF